MNYFVLFSLLLISTPSWTGPGAHGPNGEHLDSPEEVHSGGPKRLADGQVFVPKAAQRRLNIRTQFIVSSQAAASLNLPAQVIIDPNGLGRVQTPHAGLLQIGKQGLPYVGQMVKRGQLLAQIKPQADLFGEASLQAQLKQLQTEQNQLEKSLLRMNQVKESIAAKEIEAAEIRLAGIKQQQQVLQQGLQITHLYAPISGIISRVNVAHGQQLAAQQTLFEINDPQQLLVQARSPDATLASRIDSAFIPRGGKLKLLGSSPELQEGLLPLLFRPQQTSGLAIGQSLTLTVQLKQQINGLVLPATAIVRNNNNEPIVWIKVGAEKFAPQTIRFQLLDDQQAVISHGLASDNRVVIQGAALLAQIR